ncbi:sodium:proton exchanger [Neolewinella aurantiaca]|uniref:Sodium:proton exchanger n=1 Tax=Neolewinella aurantiaca TaxID=2602767 RepID=A0A5C7FNC8_9BACT|nr:cation:proton antiporter [Neolewinella aurantiaca]TXF87872.1 sodium:proton exchanger [Neolewinella aurantiaca]
MEHLDTYTLLISASVIIILSFIFGEVAKRTNVPSVLMLIILGILIKFGMDALGIMDNVDFLPVLEVLGVVGLIMIVLEAALELKLEKDKYLAIGKAMLIALLGLVFSTWAAAWILEYFVAGMDSTTAWLYATPLSILSSAIIIPSVTGLKGEKKEFHIYESTFSDILGIMLFYFLTSQLHGGTGELSLDGELADTAEHSSGALAYGIKVLITIVVSLIASYGIVLIFQRIKSHVKLFLLIAVLLLLYGIGKKFHLSSLIIILVFGLMIANMRLFFQGPLKKLLNYKQALHIYEGLHVVTIETAFVVRTFFFVIFGITIVLSSLASWNVAMVSLLIILSIYVIRFVILRIFIGADILPQLFVAPRGLITILLFYAIPAEVQVEGFEPGILLFIIIGTSLIMTLAMVVDKKRTSVAMRKVNEAPVGYEKWRAPTLAEAVVEEEAEG